MKEGDASFGSGTEGRLFGQAVLEYLEAKKSGAADRNEFLGRFAAVGAELAAFFAAEDSVGPALAPPSTLGPGAASSARSEGDPAATDAPGPFGKYTDFVHLSRGGMGAVYRCRDADLGRPLAMKVMHAHLARNPEHARSFLEEAQVAGQLTHPNIAPVHERGMLPDGRPYFTMKLVEGRTFGEAIRAYHAAATAAGFEALLRHFVAICNALAYAHQRQVLHRDLKPANVMVGAFDELLVMDWGLSKVVTGAEAAADQPEAVRTAGPADASTAGLVRGTFAYMPPEQAEPGTAELDARCDVFTLGGLLGEILTNAPPYTSAETNSDLRAAELWNAARTCATGAAFARLDASGRPAMLVTLAKRCLAREPRDRPATAKAVAEGVTAYLAGVQEKLRAAEIARTRRRWQLGLAGAVLSAVLAGLGGWRWVEWRQEQRRAQATHDVVAAVAKGQEVRDRVRRLPTNTPEEAVAALAGWNEGLATVEAAANLARANDVDPATRAAADGLQGEFETAVKDADEQIHQARREAQFTGGLRRAAMLSWARSVDFSMDYSLANEADAAAFRELGVDVLSLEPADAADLLEKEPPGVRRLAAQGLDDWRLRDPSARPRLRQIVDHLDDDPWRRTFRTALDQRDLDGLKKLAQTPGLPPRQVEWLGTSLRTLGEVEDARTLLKRNVLQFPSDLGLRMELGNSMASLPRPNYYEAVGCFDSATAISPCSIAYSNLAVARQQCGQTAEAEGAIARALELEPDNLQALCNLAYLKLTRTDINEMEALAARVLRIHPGFGPGLAISALSYSFRGNIREANKLLAQLPASSQDDLIVLLARALVLYQSGALEDSAAAFDELARTHADTDMGAFAAAFAMLIRGDSIAAEGAGRALMRRHDFGPSVLFGRMVLCAALYLEGRLPEAEAETRELLRGEGDKIIAGKMLLLEILTRQGRFSEATAVWDALVKAPSVGPVLGLFGIAIPIRNGMLTSWGEQVDRIAAGKEEASDFTTILLAEIALLKRRPALSLQLYRRAFLSLPSWEVSFRAAMGQEVGMTHRFNAAHAAVLLAAGDGLDGAKTTEDERRKARADGLKWLRAELDNWRSYADDSTWRPTVRRWSDYCRSCPDFAAVRDPAAVAKLPESEQKGWTQFWADMDAFRKVLDASAPKK